MQQKYSKFKSTCIENNQRDGDSFGASIPLSGEAGKSSILMTPNFNKQFATPKREKTGQVQDVFKRITVHQ